MATSTFGPRLAGKVCIVTGSSSGLGRAIALAYSHEGAHLVCADLQPAARASVNGEEEVNTDELIRSNGGQAIFVETDVTKTAAVEQLASRAVIQFGRIDVLVNNAGISVEAGKEPRRVHETPEDWWDLTLAVNLKSIFLVSKYVIAQMLKQDKSETGDRGWIINMSSIFGLVGGVTNGKKNPLSTAFRNANREAAYAASKGGVTNLTRTIALDYAKDGIHCNAICPGFTETAIFADTIKTYDRDLIRSMHPLHGTGSPQDLVGAAIFLASQEARWVTGVNLPVDGGYTAR
ncbi:short-chain alcohol dehydrogenase [Fusarium agapanthi]|uniref:Short-chain alcohol dehydrogenase n=1 Tax=Fusarium agapanthi TaxID=1803897 RepID=A0A9P5EGH3_9HYPO|nr:short-chain alcohol dehydrogenase [Fusarium agapanthi]